MLLYVAEWLKVGEVSLTIWVVCLHEIQEMYWKVQFLIFFLLQAVAGLYPCSPVWFKIYEKYLGFIWRYWFSFSLHSLCTNSLPVHKSPFSCDLPASPVCGIYLPQFISVSITFISYHHGRRQNLESVLEFLRLSHVFYGVRCRKGRCRKILHAEFPMAWIHRHATLYKLWSVKKKFKKP